MIRYTDLLARAAHQWPDRPALSCPRRTLTWAELLARARRLARALQGVGAGRGDRVAWLGFNAHEAVEIYYGPALIGAAAMPLNYRLSEVELTELMADSAPVVLIADEAHEAMARRLAAACPSAPKVWVTGASYEDALAGDPPPEFADAGRDDEMLILYYTGGTTGRPKGVMTTHANMFANAMGTIAAFTPGEAGRHFVTGPLFHTAGGGRVYAAALTGAEVVLLPKYDVVEAMQAVARRRVTLMQFVPTMIAMMLDHPRFGEFDMSSLRLITYGSAPMPPELLRRALRAFPGVRFGQAFGMTEASPILTVLTQDEHDPDGPMASKLSSVGRAVHYVDLKIVDETGAELPPGAAGEVWARGPNIMRGYWNRPAETAAALAGGWYHTGDAGYLDEDGYLFLTGRIKDMIVSGGENVYPIEVENVIETHPSVDSVAVIGSPDPKWGERVHAVIRLFAPATAEEIIAHARARLAHYKCPRQVSFHDGPLPLTPVNKIDKRALRRIYNEDA